MCWKNEPLTEPKGNNPSTTTGVLFNTYPLDGTVSLKLPFDFAFRSLIILIVRKDFEKLLKMYVREILKARTQYDNGTHKPGNKESLVWISSNIGVITWIICKKVYSL